MNYDDFISRRADASSSLGMPPSDVKLRDHLFPHQRALVQWSLKRGRAAIFADTGTGKTAMQLEWARNVSREGRVLILTPLAVAAQTVKEGARFGVTCEFTRDDATSPKVAVTNYDNLSKFDASKFVGVVLDESSILKNYTGAFRNQIIDAFSKTRFKLACTATPAPNDFMELGNHSEFLGIKSRVEMLAEYFVHDGGSTQDWRLKGHAEDVFWRWVSSWGAMMRMPSDLGFPDDGFQLPPLRMHEVVVSIDHREAWSSGYLFAPQAVALNDQRATRRKTLEKRVSECARLAETGDQVLVWCELNDEGDAITEAIPGAVQVSGSDDDDAKADRLLGFADGRYRVLVTKPKIAGFGMNWQRCNRIVFAGASHSYEQTYQAIRRCWRFGQTRPVDVFIIRAENEDAIVANYRRKDADAERMRAAMLNHTRDFVAKEVTGRVSREWNDYNPQISMRLPAWIEKETT